MSHKQSSLGSPFHACKWQGNRLLTECQVNSHDNNRLFTSGKVN